MRNLKGQQGFTLIEIISVLVILGILAAVAVPKYYDLQEEANKKAALAIVAESQARINLKFGEQLLAGKTCTEARDEAIKVASADLGGWDYTAPSTIEFTRETLDIIKMKNPSKTEISLPENTKLSRPNCPGDTDTPTTPAE